jgi:tetratricopeptide (TPR) repeat protein
VKRSVWALVLIFALFGCSAQPLQENILDTPGLYVSNGFKLIHKELYDDAEREFSKALRLDPKNSGAYVGIALAKGCKGEREAALDSMKRSASLAGSLEEEYRVYVGWIRLHTALGREGWLKDSEKAFFLASSMRADDPEAYFYMGLAYKKGYKIEEARAAFLNVLELRKGLVLHAENELKILKKIESANPGSDFARKMVVSGHVNRAEMAALLYYELGILDLLKKDFSSSERKTHLPRGAAGAADIADHPLRSVLEAILELKIKGLSLYRDGTFDPNGIVTRSAFSMTVADIIGRTQKGSGMERQTSKRSPYLDVKDDAPYLGAILVCVAWVGGLEAENQMFNPMGAIAGCDAVLTIQKLKARLNPP